MMLVEIGFFIGALPFIIGMMGAFLSAKRGNKESQHYKETLSSSLAQAYLVGNLSCICSFFLTTLVLYSFSKSAWGEVFGLVAVWTIIGGVISFIVGIILYLPCAFIGYNFYARRLAEQEIARTQKQILREIQTKESSEE